MSAAARTLGPEGAALEWVTSLEPVAYEEAVRAMEERVEAIADGKASELVWLLEHPHLYTAGTSAREGELIDPGPLPVYPTGRGGRLTYHGPGQRIVYVMVDLRRRFSGDVHAFVRSLEEGVIGALADFGVKGVRRDGRVGVWIAGTDVPNRDAKIAAVGVRVRRGVSYHGLALNVAPDLSWFDGIVPCGIRDHGVTSLAALGVTAELKDVDISLKGALGDLLAHRPSPAMTARASSERGSGGP